MRRFLRFPIVLLAGFVSMPAYAQPPVAVVSSYSNFTAPEDEWTEILVTSDNVSMTGFTLRDNGASQSAAAWQTPVTFVSNASNNFIWNNLRAGTVIIVWHRQLNSTGTPHPVDNSKSDGYIEVSANDAAYFTGGNFTPTGTLSVGSNGEFIQLRNTSGVSVHVLGQRVTPGTEWPNLPLPKLNHETASLAVGAVISVCPGNSINDYGYNAPQTGSTYTGKSQLYLTQGLPNDTAALNGNSNYWRSIRQPAWTSPVLNASLTPPSTINLSWNACTDPNPSDNTVGYIILRNTTNSFTAPLDGTSYTVGAFIGTAVVVASIPSSQTLTFTDTYSISCGETLYYQIYTYRYSADQPNGNGYNVARGRAYNESGFGAASVALPAAPAISTVVKTDATCGNANGTITITATGGGGGTLYSIDNGTTWQSSNVFTNLAPGSYYIVVKDVNGCMTYWSGNPVDIINLAGPSITQVVKTDATCGNNNGSITITATGGSGSTQYSIDNGVNWQTSNVFTNLAPASYFVVIKDINDCQQSWGGNPVVVANLASPTITQVVSTDASCGNNNGTITITATGGTAPLSYSIDNGTSWQGSGSFTNLAPASYTVVVTDANNCDVPYTGNPVEINMIPLPVAPTSATVDRNNLCADDAGNIVLTANGGSGLQLQWFTGSCGGTLIGTGNNLTLPSPVITTTYYVYWTSTSCGNSTCASVTVNVTDPPTVSNAGPDQSLCGVFTATLAGNQPASGTGLWTQAAGPGSSSFVNANLYNTQVTVTVYGSYTYQWTISNGPDCPPSSDLVIISFSDAVQVIAGSNSPVCENGTILLTSSISGANYSWTGPNGFTSNLQNPQIVNATAANAGTYTVTVSNIPGGCPNTTDNTAVTILPLPVAPTSALVSPDTVCLGFTGNIQLTAVGGAGDEVFWFEGSCGGTVVGTGLSINLPAPLVTTTYFASWTTAQCGNSACASVIFTVLEPPTPADAGPDQSWCGVLSSVMAANSPVNGSGLWSAVSGPGSVTFSDPTAYNSQVTVTAQGIYILRWSISNGNICPASQDDVSVDFGDAIGVDITSNSPVCTGDDITLTSSISGAFYAWTGPNGFTSNLQNPVISNAVLADGGLYEVQVTNIPGGCPDTSNTTTVVVNQSASEPLSVSASIDTLCFGTTGNLTLTATGGYGTELEWFSGSCGGTQIGTGTPLTVTIPTATTTYFARWASDFCGESNCLSTTVVVVQPPTPAFAGTDQSICNLMATMLQGNQPMIGEGLWTVLNGPGTVSFSDPTAPNPIVSVSAMGVYRFRWTISNGTLCPDSEDDVTVEFGDLITVTASSNGPVCEGDTLKLFASIAGATYAWNGPGGFSSNLQNPVIPNATLANGGTYSIDVTGIPGGCPNSSNSTTVEVGVIPVQPQINSQNVTGNQQEVCEGSTFTYNVVNPVAGSGYTWALTGGGFIQPSGSPDMVDIQWTAPDGTYDLTVFETNATGCAGNTATLSVTINPSITPSIVISTDDTTVCAGSAVTFTAIAFDTGPSPSYLWQRNGVDAGSDSVYVLEDPVQNDLVTCRITSANPCAVPSSVTSNVIRLTVLDPVTISCSDQDPICAGTPTLLTPGEGFVAYLWSDGSTTSSITVQEAGVYWVRVTDGNGCFASDTVTLEPCAVLNIYAPNAFTPNNDGMNDRFRIVISNADLISHFQMDIYNRWGQRLYRTDNMGDGWSGNFNGSACPVDIYTYVIIYSIAGDSGEPKQRAGTFALVR